MYKKFTIIFFAIFLTLSHVQNVHAQSLLWAKKCLPNALEPCYIALSTFDNVYVTGALLGSSVDFDPGAGVTNLTSNGGNDIFISKLDSSGNFIWAKGIGGGLYDYVEGIVADASGNVYLTGSFQGGVVDFDPGTGVSNFASQGNSDIFVVKLDANGNYLWAKTMGGSASDIGKAITLDLFGNIYVTGEFSGTVDFNPGTGVTNLTANGMNDIFISKLDTNGNYVWAKAIGSMYKDSGIEIAIDSTGSVYTTGSFNGSSSGALTPVDFDPGMAISNLTPIGLSSFGDIFITKLDVGGNYVWAKNIGNANLGSVNFIVGDLALDASGSVFITGNFAQTVDFDPGPGNVSLTSAGSADAFVLKLSSMGNYVWAKSFGGSGSETSFSIALDMLGNVYTTGSFTNTVDFDPGSMTAFLTSNAGLDNFISKLDINGNYLWAKAIGGSGVDAGYDLVLGSSNRIYTSGRFQGVVDFDPSQGVTNLTGPGGFVCKIEQPQPCVVFSFIYEYACDSFTFNGNNYTASGVYVDTLLNVNNCDSIVTLTLTLTNDSIILTQISCDSFNLGNQTYTNSGIYVQTYTNATNCDSVVILNLTILHTTVHTISGQYCDSVVINGQTYFTSGIYNQIFTNPTVCDSVLILDLEIGHTNYHPITEIKCGSSFTLNGETYNQSGTYFQIKENQSGCDSIITLNLTLNTIPSATILKVGTTLISSQAESYQWIDCGNGNNLIPGATNNTFNPSWAGSFAVIVTIDGCSDTSVCIDVQATDIEDFSYESSIEIYPNPSYDIFTLSSDRALKGASLSIIDLFGQRILERRLINGHEHKIDLSSYPIGMYILSLEENGKLARFKIIKL